MSVSRAFALTFGALALLVLVSQSLLLQRLAAQRDAERRIQTHEVVGSSVAHSVRTALGGSGPREADVAAAEAAASTATFNVRWVWLDAQTSRAPERPVHDVERTHFSAVTMEIGGRPTLVSYTPAHTVRGLGAVEITEPLPDAGPSVAELVLLNAAVLAVLFALAGWLLGVRLVGRPIAALTALARRIGNGELSATAELRTGTELDMLADAMARMARSLDAQGRERDAALAQARHADRLASVGKLAAGLAHELGTPLNVVRGRARTLQQNDLDAEEVANAASEIIGETDRMADLVRQLLNFAGRRGGVPARIDAGDVVRHALSLLEPTARKRGIMFRTSLEETPVLAHADQLQQVVTNLVLNAIHASPNGGEVEIALRRNAGEVRLEVRDHGGGLSAQVLDHLFEPFFTTKPPGEGTGLGLAVSFGIARELGGRIDASNAPDGGARFEVVLPAAEAAP